VSALMVCGKFLKRILDHLMVFPLRDNFIGMTAQFISAIPIHIAWSICPPIGLYTAISL